MFGPVLETMLESYLEKVVNLGEYYLTQSTLF
jgi:hypothetical protein